MSDKSKNFESTEETPWGVVTHKVETISEGDVPITCPKCLDANTLIYIAHNSNKNVFLGCASYPDCDFNQQIPEAMRKLYARSLQHHTKSMAKAVRRWADKFDPRKKTFSFLHKLSDKLDDITGRKFPSS